MQSPRRRILPAMTTLPGPGLSLLIVDDHAGVRDIIRTLLRPFVGEARECASGEEAVALCEGFTPDCVTVDLRMSGMSGFAAVQRIRAAHPGACIVVVTQLEADVLREKARAAGADAYVCKDNLSPLRTLVAALPAALRGR